VSYDLEQLYELLPAVYRVRDAELEEGASEDERLRPLGAFLSVLAEQAQALEESIEQLYDDQFIETCADWVVPYIGDLVGARGLHILPNSRLTERAQVANTLAYRRRKGTVAVLEQLARDVTEWDAVAVEYFKRLITTQHVRHLRLQNSAWVDMRPREPLERLGTPFDSLNHTLDVRRIASGRGKHNIPNVGIFLWRIGAYSATEWPAVRVDADRYMFSPLGQPLQLFNQPEPEDDVAHPTVRANIPQPFTRRELGAEKSRYYGRDAHGEVRSILVTVDGTPVPTADIDICDLSDEGGTWAHVPRDRYAIDPMLGRLAVPGPHPSPEPPIKVSFFYGFPDDLGGGEYDRAATLDDELRPVCVVPAVKPILQEGLDTIAGAGAVEIADSGRYELGAKAPAIHVKPSRRVELRAADARRPFVRLTAETTVSGGLESELILNGLLIAGAALVIDGGIRRVTIRHCTLVPGLELDAVGDPTSAGAPSLIIKANDALVRVEHSIVGAVRAVRGSTVEIERSIVDANGTENVAYAAVDGAAAGGPVRIVNSTIVGRVHAEALPLVSNSILFADPVTSGAWQSAVRAERRQEGCIRFSYVRGESEVPRRFACRPAAGDDPRAVRPQFTSLRYGHHAYAQLSRRTSAKVRQGADDEAEMGVYHDLYQPQREANLRLRLDEYLRFGLEAGIFYAS
jgi:hypothetical protein